MASRLNWVKARLREVIQHGRNGHGCSNNRSLEGSPQLIRSLTYYHMNRSSSSYNNNIQSRQAAADDAADKHFQYKSALRETIDDLINRARRGTPVDSYKYVAVLHRCIKQRDLESAEQVHYCIKKSGMEQNKYVASCLLKCYIRCGKMQNAQELFSKLLTKDVISWNTMIGGYADHDQGEEAIKIYKQLRNEGEQPTAITYVSALKACASPTALKWGKEIHGHIVHDGFDADKYVCTALVHMYAKCGSVDEARMVFSRMEERDVVTWNVMISGLAQHGLGKEAFSLFLEMQKDGIVPNVSTYLGILNLNSCEGALTWVKVVHNHAARTGLITNLRVGTALMQMYSKCGSVDDARMVLEGMEERDTTS